MLLLKGETWFPQKDKRISPREILRSECGQVRYRTTQDGRGLPLVRTVSSAAMLAWIRKWDCKL